MDRCETMTCSSSIGETRRPLYLMTSCTCNVSNQLYDIDAMMQLHLFPVEDVEQAILHPDDVPHTEPPISSECFQISFWVIVIATSDHRPFEQSLPTLSRHNVDVVFINKSVKARQLVSQSTSEYGYLMSMFGRSPLTLPVVSRRSGGK